MAESAKKRRVKNPETFRERAIKASEAGDKPDRRSQAKTVIAKRVSPLAPVAYKAKKAFERQPLKLVAKLASLIGRLLLPKYVRKSWQELRLVEWPRFRDSLRLTRAVLIFAIIFGAAIAGVDYVLEKVFEQILIK